MNTDLQKIVMQAVDLPTIPVVAKKVVKSLANPNSNLSELSKLISTDQALSARILKIANSAMYYCQREITTLTMAMSRIGFASLKSIVVAVSTKEIYKTFGESERLLWEHSVGVSIACQNLSDMPDLDIRPPAAQPALDIHQTAHVAADNGIGAGINNIFDLVFNHGGGYIRILHRKRSAESATFI